LISHKQTLIFNSSLLRISETANFQLICTHMCHFWESMDPWLKTLYNLLQGRLSSPTAMTQPFPLDSLLSASLLFLSLPSLLLRESGVWPPEIFFGITDARRRILEHFGHKNQHLYEPGFLTVSCKFRISSKCACSIVNKWSSVCDHLTEIPPFCWVIAAWYCYKLSDRGRLAVALHYTEFQAIFSSPPLKFQWRNVRHSPHRIDASDLLTVIIRFT